MQIELWREKMRRAGRITRRVWKTRGEDGDKGADARACCATKIETVALVLRGGRETNFYLFIYLLIKLQL